MRSNGELAANCLVSYSKGDLGVISVSLEQYQLFYIISFLLAINSNKNKTILECYVLSTGVLSREVFIFHHNRFATNFFFRIASFHLAVIIIILTRSVMAKHFSPAGQDFNFFYNPAFGVSVTCVHAFLVSSKCL
uniref:Uncharacterized protein n=1 Tax=Octopus bimaculoides TaxID=37653 RepID=A0A0L8HBI0_OCTBM